jgi:hypothetical protein
VDKEESRGDSKESPHPPIDYQKQRVLAAWKSRWLEQETQSQGKPDYKDQIKRLPDLAILQLHKGLPKAENIQVIAQGQQLKRMK